MLMSFSNTIVLFYVAAVMLGLGEITILWLAIPTLINRWFVERAGFFIGLCMAFTGIGGAIWSAVFTALTASGVDFHTIYLIWGVIALVTSLPLHAVLRAQLARGTAGWPPTAPPCRRRPRALRWPRSPRACPPASS